MDDDYVAQLLTNEARNDSDKYAKEGLGAYTSRRPKGNAPKPNTRFLRHLINETNSHNSALKRKEERESRERMRALKKFPGLSSRKHEASTPEHGRNEEREDRYGRLSRALTPDRERSRRHRRRDGDDDKAKEERGDRSEHRRERRSEKYKSDRRDRERSYSRSRSRSPRSHRSSRHHRSERRHRRSESPHSHKKHSERSSKAEDDHKSRSFRHEHKSPPPSATRKSRDPVGEDSDPLEDIIGPIPPRKDQEPIRSRGRGVYKSRSSAMDAHFALDYDPRNDIQPDDDDDDDPATQKYFRRPVAGLMTAEDDWDMSLEAIRDRSRWKQKGEERLRAAGIDEKIIERWKGNAVTPKVPVDERGPDDVRWAKKGEDREWDRGKFVDDDGHINVRAAWPST